MKPTQKNHKKHVFSADSFEKEANELAFLH
ncbi:hypothetical protein V202x_45320 [Gimesia aquarii]|uniref:Uncharacterized protein n=1 Tax=Gimesia aquarii TaxID=2527964 RepID=A0A517X0S9_9PLAN|nr:hypothetical protein V202x_45320 [Gimesia aquarii]